MSGPINKQITNGWSLARKLEYWSEPHPSGCRLWTGKLRPDGRGEINIDGVAVLAHRAAWVSGHGPIPAGKCVLHTCDVGHCIADDHLFLGTQLDNIADCIAKGRHTKGVIHGHAKLDDMKVMEIRQALGDGRAPHKELKRLAAQFKVSRGVIYTAWKGITWKHLT